MKDHMRDCIADELTVVVMPEEKECVEFTNWEYTLRKPHAIYADFESCLVRKDVVKGMNTTQTQIHKPAAYCYHLVSDIDPVDNITAQYTAKTNDENIPLHFIKSLSEMVNRLGEKYAESRPMVITEEEQALFNAATTCWVCGEETVDGDEKLKKVRDHCHFTGKYRGAAHNVCNLKLKRDKSIPVLFHNGKGYDFHLFMRDLGRIPGKISVIANNEEQYISITKNIIVGEKNTWRLRFLDSCGSLQASLDELFKNSVREDFEATFKEFGESDMLLRKGVFPYEWFDDIEKLDKTGLPPIQAFHSSLTGEGVSEKDYESSTVPIPQHRK